MSVHGSLLSDHTYVKVKGFQYYLFIHGLFNSPFNCSDTVASNKISQKGIRDSNYVVMP
jgi:hypothetical protein